ncbi:MAG TPA: amidohydrolase family protein [Candidatus Hydrogenedentes bacterium]|nr:amidohydrolase family protein [Candidatus Hydrogenedentota bacterium]
MSAPITDVHVTLSRWPFRRLPLDETPALVEALQSRGIAQAWAGSFDALLHKDIASVNARLSDECAKHGSGVLLPFGAVNPKLPDWEEDLRRCAETFGMRGIRLHPNYHGYTLNEPVFAQLLQRATDHKLIVQITTAMEDERMMHPLMQVKPVDVNPLVDLLPAIPGARIVLLNALRTVPAQILPKIIGAGEVYAEIASLEGVGGIANILQRMPVERLLFGSHAPLFYLDSALLKCNESSVTAEQRRAIQHENAARLLGSS